MTISMAGSPYSSTSSTMAIPGVEYIVPPEEHDVDASPESQRSQRTFKRHKVLPHPRSANGSFSNGSDSARTPSTVSQSHTLRHQRRRISGGDLPPTPPAHSRTSSSSHSIPLSGLSPLQTPAQSSEDVPSKASPSTPPNQRSPPTPDVTPPQSAIRPRPLILRPALTDRVPSKATTESRTESFKTARESPEPSDEEDGRSTLRPAAQSARTSEVTVRLAKGQTNGSERHTPKNHSGSGLGLGPSLADDNSLTPKAKGDFTAFDGDFGSSPNDVEQEWDDNLMRNVTVRKRRPSAHNNGRQHEVVDDFTVSPTNATRAVRAFPLKGRILTYDSTDPSRSFTAPERANTDAVTSADSRRLSGMSSKSAASTVVEAILVGTPPRRQRTLRHVKRVDALRDSIWQPSLVSSATTLNSLTSRRQSADQAKDVLRESYASNSTVNSVGSRKARRDVWKNGGIPVVVVPDRQSSNRSSSRERSLRSADSRRSKSQSLGSVPLDKLPNGQDLTPYFDRPPRRGRSISESDGSTPGDQQRTMDFPPVVPQRASSLSAPTSQPGSRSQSRDASRNGSRAGSLTADSLRAHNAMQANGYPTKPAPAAAERNVVQPSGYSEQVHPPAVTVNPVPSLEHFKPRGEQDRLEAHQPRQSASRIGELLLSAKATPFSQASVETNGTSAADIGEARAISMFPHQNRSILVVDHRPSESSDGDPGSQSTERPNRPTITTTEVDGISVDEPSTPLAQPTFTLDSVDSPLRNPREPPEPPAIKFIPATPSGLTPAEEKTKMLGNFYDDLDEKPKKAPSLVRRALSKRRHSYASYGPSPNRDTRPGLLARTLSLGKNTRKGTMDDPEVDQPHGESLPHEQPMDETRLHPDWRPSYYPSHYDDDGIYDMEGEDEEEVMRYPSIDNRPPPPKRSLSERMKRTFAIMPLQDEDAFISGPDKRTIRRTPSGNLRVVKHRGSVGSLRNKASRAERPSTAPDGDGRRRLFWSRSNSLSSIRGSHASANANGTADRATPPRTSETRRWSMSQNLGALTRRLSDKRREKRSNELRKKISGPREVRDGVVDVIRQDGYRPALSQPRRMPQRIDGS
ncbi:hypothetical protein KVR01_001457 [Diaporthe batatas]|uniref:uncharacterized protein n=1 Tax=Diaporthe batatas TaxID=748121 RepID=UPI001D054946|nr:uncharacterized protein KVR01_001457 [Diaporthe batatas]KAG8168708.1 hypothetical protein KVR01_001457 [Diaporthe batatas]